LSSEEKKGKVDRRNKGTHEEKRMSRVLKSEEVINQHLWRGNGKQAKGEGSAQRG